MQLEAIVPVGRWKGFGGETNFNGEGFEVFAWAAGLSAATRYSSVFATSHIPTVHPLFAAKQAAAIDHIGHGRFTLNLVTGWYVPEMEMFGIQLLDHDSRYEMAEEWVQIVTRLWTDPEPFDFLRPLLSAQEGRACAEADPAAAAAVDERCRLRSRPPFRRAVLRRLLHRAGKPRCRSAQSQGSTNTRNFAREEFGRDIQVWSNAYVFQGDNEADGKALWRHCVEELGDWQGVQNMLDVMGVTSQLVPATGA